MYQSIGEFIWRISPFIGTLSTQILYITGIFFISVIVSFLLGVIPSYLVWRYKLDGKRKEFWKSFMRRGLLSGSICFFIFYNIGRVSAGFFYNIGLWTALLVPSLSMWRVKGPIEILNEMPKFQEYKVLIIRKIKNNLNIFSLSISLFLIIGVILELGKLFWRTDLSVRGKEALMPEISHFFSVGYTLGLVSIVLVCLIPVISKALLDYLTVITDPIIAKIPEKQEKVFKRFEKSVNTRERLAMIGIVFVVSFFMFSRALLAPSEITEVSIENMVFTQWSITSMLLGMSLVFVFLIFRISKLTGKLDKMLKNEKFTKHAIESHARRWFSQTIIVYFIIILLIPVLFIFFYLISNIYVEGVLPVAKMELSSEAIEFISPSERFATLLSISQRSTVKRLITGSIKIISPFFWATAGIPLLIYYLQFFKLKRLTLGISTFIVVSAVQILTKLIITGEITNFLSIGIFSLIPALFASFVGGLSEWFSKQTKIKECSKCGGNNLNDAEFCSHCGSRL